MTKGESINYIETKSEYKVLTKIHGEPNYKSIRLLFNQVKANAASVPSNLGGGAHGHLGLVLTPAKYALVSAVPFDWPAHPGPYVLPQNGTAAQIAATKEIHEEAMQVLREVLNVKAALHQQIVSAIDNKYLTAICDRQTNAIRMNVSDIIIDGFLVESIFL